MLPENVENFIDENLFLKGRIVLFLFIFVSGISEN